jgi:hypothetical protein
MEQWWNDGRETRTSSVALGQISSNAGHSSTDFCNNRVVEMHFFMIRRSKSTSDYGTGLGKSFEWSKCRC